jgi:dCTP deaminase
LGLQVHATAGFVDPGFEGTLTFELINAGKLPVKFAPGQRLGQLCLYHLTPVEVPYNEKRGAKYGKQFSVEISRIERDAEIARRAARRDK